MNCSRVVGNVVLPRVLGNVVPPKGFGCFWDGFEERGSPEGFGERGSPEGFGERGSPKGFGEINIECQIEGYKVSVGPLK